MHPSVDMTSTPSPSTMLSTSGNTSEPSAAHLLIKELTMRNTIALLLSLTASACVGDVGNGPGGNTRTTEGSGSGTTPAGCQKVETPVTIRSAADFDTLPKGCWDLWAPLTLQGSSITSLSKLGELVAVNELSLVGTGLTTLDAKPFTIYGEVTITGNASLKDLKNVTVERADDLALSVTVDGNAQLASLDGLANIATVDGDLVITNNAKLTTASFTTLTTVAGAVRIVNNAALTTVDLAAATIVGSVDVSSNGALTTFKGPSATEMAGFTLRGNRVLANAPVMPALSRVTGNVTIDNNAALANLTLLPTTLQYVTGVFTISNNAALTNLGQTSHLLGIGSASITGNANLDFCEAHEVDHCVGQLGSISIANNKQQSANNCDCYCAQ